MKSLVLKLEQRLETPFTPVFHLHARMTCAGLIGHIRVERSYQEDQQQCRRVGDILQRFGDLGDDSHNRG